MSILRVFISVVAAAVGVFDLRLGEHHAVGDHSALIGWCLALHRLRIAFR